MTTTTGAPWNLRKPSSTDALASIDDQVRNLADDVDAALDTVDTQSTGVLASGTATINGSTVRRRNRTGLLKLDNLSLTTNVAANGTVCTIPAGFRPAVDWNGVVLNVSSGAVNLLTIVAATGVCTIRSAATSGQALYGSVAFPL